MYLGTGSAVVDGKEYRLTSNVYLPSEVEERGVVSNWPRLAADLYNRPQFLGQFWMGVVVWPAIYQYATNDDQKRQALDREEEDKRERIQGFMRTPSNRALNAVHTTNSKIIDLGWVYTVIAGVLNIMVIYDALAGPAYPPVSMEPTEKAVT
jgi:hypothetical protein